MRIADVLGTYVDRELSIVEFDSLGLNLARYLADIPVTSWPKSGQPLSQETLVLASIRSAQQLEQDLRSLESRVKDSDPGILILLCMEDAFEAIPVPTLTAVCERNGWYIERIGELSATRVRSGILIQARGTKLEGWEAERLRLHNALVLTDYERRRLEGRLRGTLRSMPRVVPVTRQVLQDPDPDKTAREVDERTRLWGQIEQLSAERDDIEGQWRAVAQQLRQLQESASYIVGRALVQGRRHPSYLARLPRDLSRRLKKGRQPTTLSAETSLRNGASNAPTAAAGRSTVPVASERQFLGLRARYLSAEPARLRVATVARAHLVERLRYVADVIHMPAGGWFAPPETVLASADVLMVDASVGSALGVWRWLGEPGEVDRTSELMRLLDLAELNGIPSVLLVSHAHVPAGLRKIEGRFSLVVPWSLGPTGWDPGIPLTQLPWPGPSDRIREPVHLVDNAGPGSPTAAPTGWLRAFRSRGLQRWYVGTDTVDGAINASDIDTLTFPAMPFSRLMDRATILTQSKTDDLAALAGIAAGCNVLARKAIDSLLDEPGVTVVEQAKRALSVLDDHLPPLSPDDVLAVRRRLLDHGSAQERVIKLSEILHLPLTESLRRQMGISVLAAVPDRRTGEALARDILTQLRPPSDVVVATDEATGPAWLDEMSGAGIRVTLLPWRSRWSQLAGAAHRALTVIWHGGQIPLEPTSLADIELMALAPDRLVHGQQEPVTIVDRSVLRTDVSPVSESTRSEVGEAR